jgi:Phage integrase SAM-like domain
MADLLQIINQFLNNKRIYTGKEKPFWDAYNEYIHMLNIAPYTKQNYKLYFTKLQEFEKETGYLIDYTTITPAFNIRYKNYMLSENGLSRNTTQRQ